MTTEYDKENHWYGWNGGECPVHPETTIHVIHEDGADYRGPAKSLDWGWGIEGGQPRTVCAFRIIKLYREPRKAREWWMAIREDGVIYTADTRTGADEFDCQEVVHVREVLEPSDEN
jgi:hypothetical protein